MASLHAPRDRLTVEETAHFGAQLPMLIRGFYYEGGTLVAAAVFTVLASRVTEKERSGICGLRRR